MNLLLKRIKILKKIIALYERLLGIKKGKNFEAFAEALGQRESGGRYKIVNAYGYLGKYQFGLARLYDLGYTERKEGTKGYRNSAFRWKKGYSQSYFLNNPNFQERVFREHCKNLIIQIKRKFSKYLGKQINGVDITLSGCIAGAHLGGIGGVRKFLKGYDNQDQLMVSLR